MQRKRGRDGVEKKNTGRVSFRFRVSYRGGKNLASSGANEPASLTSLLSDLARDHKDPNAWRLLYGSYWEMIRGICKRHGLQDADADDVAQEILQKIHGSASKFSRAAGDARAWLRTIALNTLRDWWKSPKNRNRAAGDERAQAMFENLADETASSLEPGFTRDVIVNEAIRRARERVGEQTWKIYIERYVRERPTREVADELNISDPDVIYQARSRLYQMIREEYESITGEKLPETE